MVCLGYLGRYDPLLNLLSQVETELLRTEDEKTAVAFVPMNRLLEPKFFSHLVKANERFAMRESATTYCLDDQATGFKEADADLETVDSALSLIPLTPAAEGQPPRFHHRQFLERLDARSKLFAQYKQSCVSALAQPTTVASETVQASLAQSSVELRLNDPDQPPSVIAPWQAVWSKSKEKWYFFNTDTGDTQWVAPQT